MQIDEPVDVDDGAVFVVVIDVFVDNVLGGALALLDDSCFAFVDDAVKDYLES